jgi:6-phosphofructokinase
VRGAFVNSNKMLIEAERTSQPVLGVICGGTPVPGLNSVIASSTAYALELGWRVLAFQDGYVHLSTGDPEIVKQHTSELTRQSINHISRTGGSIIICDRYDPTRYPESVSNVNKMLEYFNVRYLLIIGGTDKVRSAHIITQGVDPFDMATLVIPKTIDNDVCLPYGQSTFGFQSACQFGTKIVKNIVMDSYSVPRWHIVEICGRQSGHLALNIGIASAVNLIVIPEAFGTKRIDINDILDMIEGAIYKRLAAGKNYGVCVVSEGLVGQMNGKSQQQIFKDGYITYENDGYVKLDDADLSHALKFALMDRLNARGIKIRLNTHKLGPELRGCNPNSFDEIYSKELGYAAIEGFRTGHSNSMVIWENGRIYFRSFKELMDSANRIYPRRVDPKCEEFLVAYKYMWTVTKADLSDKETVEKLSKAANMTPEQFVKVFSKIVSKISQ